MSKISENKNELTDKQELFCREYIKDLNATQAAIRAGYSEKTANEQAARLLAKVSVISFIQKLQQKRANKLDISAESILRELLKLAMVDITQAFDEHGNVKKLSEIPEDVRKAISSLESQEIFSGRGEDQEIVGVTKKIKFYDKNKALELIGKHLKLFTDRHEHSGVDGKPIETINRSELTDEQLDAKIQSILTKVNLDEKS